MPYEYQRLTPDERQAILSQRAARGYPLHAPPHPYQLAGRFLVSAANFEHQRLMADVGRRTDFEERLLQALKAADIHLLAWVVLPNHYHALIEVDSLLKVAAALKLLHGRTSREWNLADGQTGQRRVWYHFSDRWIRDEDQLFRVLNYVHYNPVKHGYTPDPYEWPWTSIHNYRDAFGRDWLRERWRLYPPGDFGKGWDSG
jgi:putative transposase